MTASPEAPTVSDVNQQVSPYTAAGVVVMLASLVLVLIAMNAVPDGDSAYPIAQACLLGLIPGALGVALVGLGKLIRR